jgi:hypothetical protein
MPTSGRDLRIERLMAEVTIVALAARMGLSRQALWVIERQATVDPGRAAQYRSALQDVITTPKIAAATA